MMTTHKHYAEGDILANDVLNLGHLQTGLKP